MKVYKRGIIKSFVLFIIIPVMALSCFCFDILLQNDIEFLNSKKRLEHQYVDECVNCKGAFETELNNEQMSLDYDSDGVINEVEEFYGTSVYAADTDCNGVDDNVEIALLNEQMAQSSFWSWMSNNFKFVRKAGLKLFGTYDNAIASGAEAFPWVEKFEKEFKLYFSDPEGYIADTSTTVYEKTSWYLEGYKGNAFDSLKKVRPAFVVRSEDSKVRDVNFWISTKTLNSYEEKGYVYVFLYEFDLEGKTYNPYAYYDLDGYRYGDYQPIFSEVTLRDNHAYCMIAAKEGSMLPDEETSYIKALFLNDETASGQFVSLSNSGSSYMFYSCDADKEEEKLFKSLLPESYVFALGVKEDFLSILSDVYEYDNLMENDPDAAESYFEQKDKNSESEEAEEVLWKDTLSGILRKFFVSFLADNYEVSFYNNKSMQAVIDSLYGDEQAINCTDTKKKMKHNTIKTGFSVKEDTFSFNAIGDSNMAIGMAEYVSNYYNYKKVPPTLSGNNFTSVLKETGINLIDFVAFSELKRSPDECVAVCCDYELRKALEERTASTLATYSGEFAGRYNNYSVVKKVLSYLEKGKTVVAYITNGKKTTAVVVYAAYYTSEDRNTIKLKVYDPNYQMNSIKIYDPAMTEVNSYPVLNEITIYVEPYLAITVDKDTSVMKEVKKHRYKFEYGNYFSYTWGNTSRFKNGYWYGGDQIYFAKVQDMSKDGYTLEFLQ